MTTLLPAALGLLLQSTALLTLGLLALWLTRRRGPAVQTLIERATLVGVALTLLAVPLSGHVQPLWRVPVPESPAFKTEGVGVPPAPNSGGAGLETAPPAAAPAIPAGPAAELPPASSPSQPPERPVLAPRPFPLHLLYVALAVGWGLGTVLLMLWLGVCQWHLTSLRRTARVLTTGPASDALAALAGNPPRLLAHTAVRSPFLAGIVRPTIFLPDGAEADFSPEALGAILAHELAHLARRDNAWTLLCRILCAVLWPQPLLWVLCQRLDAVGEEACDQAVLAHACPPRAYADCLLTLAERWQPSRRERTLAAGVAPFRSAVGRRVAQIVAASRRPSPNPTRRFRMGIAFCALLAATGSVLLLNAGADVNVPHFEWAKQQGWRVQPIRVIDLDHPGLTRVASLPYGISDRDEATVKECSSHYGVINLGPAEPTSEKIRLEAVLAAQPHFFYAEYLLGEWYRHHGDRAHASALLAQSLGDAPVILAGRYEYDDGTPLVGFHFSTTVLCYSPAHLKSSNTAFQNIAVQLGYSDVVTDSEGCYYLPAFRAIYSQQGVGYAPDELDRLTAAHLKAHADPMTPGPATSGTTSNNDGEHLDKGFIAESRVAVMPQTEVRARLALSTPFNAAEGSNEKPLRINGSKLTVSWQPYPKAVSYKVMVDEHHPQRDRQGRMSGDEWSEVQASPSNPARLGLPITQTSVSLDFAGTDPVFNRALPYTLTVMALDRDGETISQSDQFHFQPWNALAPQPLTKAALARELGPGFTVTSIQYLKDEVVVNAITPANFQYSAQTDIIGDAGRLFGLTSGGWSAQPGLNMDGPNSAQPIKITFEGRIAQGEASTVKPDLNASRREQLESKIALVQSIHFLDNKIAQTVVSLRRAEMALGSYRAKHPTRPSQRRLADLMRDYQILQDEYNDFKERRFALQAQSDLMRFRGRP